MKPKLERINNKKHPDTFAYNWFFYSSAIRGVLRKHRVVFKHRRIGRDSHFKLYRHSQKKWYQLFAVPANVVVPFTYSDFSRAVGFMKVIDGLGANFKYLLHLKSEFWFYHDLVPGETYVIDYVFEDVLRIKKDKAAMIGRSEIHRNGECYAKMRDHFVIKEVCEKYADRLQPDKSEEFKGITHLPAEPLQNCSVEEIYISADLAKRYGNTSGDKNFVHTSPRIAKRFGYDRPFIQGLCTANLIMSRLCLAGIKLEHFSITFCNPVLSESIVCLCYTDKEYRLVDEADNVLCFGGIN